MFSIEYTFDPKTCFIDNTFITKACFTDNDFIEKTCFTDNSKERSAYGLSFFFQED